MLKEFKPKEKPQKALNISEIELLLKKGKFKQAYRHCCQMGYQLDRFDSFRKMCRRMFHSRPGELLSLIHKYGVDVGYDPQSILRSQFNRNDYHGFLKNVYQFRMLDNFKSEVEAAISNLKRAEEVQSWRTKFEKLSKR